MARGIKGKITRRFILFTCSSLVSTLLDQVIAWTLFDVLRKPFANSDYARILVSSVIARVCSVALNYVINSRLVFQDRQSGASEGEIEQEESEGGIPTKRSLPRFIATAALVLFLSSLGCSSSIPSSACTRASPRSAATSRCSSSTTHCSACGSSRMAGRRGPRAFGGVWKPTISCAGSPWQGRGTLPPTCLPLRGGPWLGLPRALARRAGDGQPAPPSGVEYLSVESRSSVPSEGQAHWASVPAGCRWKRRGEGRLVDPACVPAGALPHIGPLAASGSREHVSGRAPCAGLGEVRRLFR